MGQAKQRRLAKAAGKPWPEDMPKVFLPAEQYLGDDGEWHPQGDRYHRRPRRISPTLALLSAMTGISSKKGLT